MHFDWAKLLRTNMFHGYYTCMCYIYTHATIHMTRLIIFLSLCCIVTLFFVLISPHVFFFVRLHIKNPWRLASTVPMQCRFVWVKGSEGQLHSTGIIPATYRESVLFIGTCLQSCVHTVCFSSAGFQKRNDLAIQTTDLATKLMWKVLAFRQK